MPIPIPAGDHANSRAVPNPRKWTASIPIPTGDHVNSRAVQNPRKSTVPIPDPCRGSCQQPSIPNPRKWQWRARWCSRDPVRGSDGARLTFGGFRTHGY